MAFSLERFEYDSYNRNYEAATLQLIELISSLDQNFGSSGNDFTARLQESTQTTDLAMEHLATRICSAISSLFSDSSFFLTESGTNSILSLHRWLSSLFSASPFRNADHILRSLSTAPPNDDSKDIVNVHLEALNKLCVLYTTESEIPLDLDALWDTNPNLVLGLCLVLLSPRFLGAPKAHEKRELLLPWVTQKLLEINDFENLPTSILHDVYMHCSYADRKDKHEIKGSINIVLKRMLHKEGINDLPTLPLLKHHTQSKPTLLVVLEWFNKNHSIFRTHSRTIESSRELFHLVGVGYDYGVDESGRKLFDEFISLDANDGIYENLRQIRSIAKRTNAEVLYMPSIGMFPLTMFLSNLRFAPLQAIALGHPATTHSPQIDFVIVEEDYVGDPDCFSEKLLILPKDGMPYRPSALAENLDLGGINQNKPDVVQICVASTPMKINPNFLVTCAAIAEKSKSKVHFNFLVGQAVGLIYPQVRRVVQQFLGDNATVFPHQNYQDYMIAISKMDLFINPFPFGNTNGIIDTVTAGLVGICKTGPEVHEHIDEGLFRRLNFPSWTIAETTQKYIESSVRLIDNHKERVKLRLELSGEDRVAKLFNGRPKIMGRMLYHELNKLN